MRENPASLATTLLTSRSGNGGASPLTTSEYWALRDQFDDLGDLLGSSAADLVAVHGIEETFATRIAVLLDRATSLAFELERREQAGITTLTTDDEGYPQRLRERLGPKSPPLLHVAGDVALLARPGIGVVGSRDVTQAGADVAREAAKTAVKLGYPLVSGGARGVDQLAMNAAHEAGGAVVALVADSLTRTLGKSGTRRAIHDGQICICTPYRPDAPFSVGNAMGRNKLVYASSIVTLVVASADGTGGTWAGATEALKHGFGGVAVWRGVGEGPGNASLEKAGAVPMADVAALGGLAVDEREPQEVPEQQTLFG